MTAVTVDQLRNLTDRAARGLTSDEQQRLRDGLARLEQAEAAIARVHAKLDEIADFATRLDTSDTVPYHDAVDSIRATLPTRPAATEAPDPTQCDGEEGFCPVHGFHRHSLKQPGPLTPVEEPRLAQSGIDTPGCTCGHTGRGVSWHADDCLWRRSVVDCPGRPTPG